VATRYFVSELLVAFGSELVLAGVDDLSPDFSPEEADEPSPSFLPAAEPGDEFPPFA
jgi:hypothetical protein